MRIILPSRNSWNNAIQASKDKMNTNEHIGFGIRNRRVIKYKGKFVRTSTTDV